MTAMVGIIPGRRDAGAWDGAGTGPGRRARLIATTRPDHAARHPARTAGDDGTDHGACRRGARRADGPVPQLQVDPFWPKPLPNNWVLGQVTGVAVDKRGHVWIIHRPRSLSEREVGAPAGPADQQVLLRGAAGAGVRPLGQPGRYWGGAGEGYDWPENEHGIFVDDDDFVWVAGNGAKDHQF